MAQEMALVESSSARGGGWSFEPGCASGAARSSGCADDAIAATAIALRIAVVQPDASNCGAPGSVCKRARRGASITATASVCIERDCEGA
jgi:hypothetical protein